MLSSRLGTLVMELGLCAKLDVVSLEEAADQRWRVVAQLASLVRTFPPSESTGAFVENSCRFMRVIGKVLAFSHLCSGVLSRTEIDGGEILCTYIRGALEYLLVIP